MSPKCLTVGREYFKKPSKPSSTTPDVQGEVHCLAWKWTKRTSFNILLLHSYLVLAMSPSSGIRYMVEQNHCVTTSCNDVDYETPSHSFGSFHVREDKQCRKNVECSSAVEAWIFTMDTFWRTQICCELNNLSSLDHGTTNYREYRTRNIPQFIVIAYSPIVTMVGISSLQEQAHVWISTSERCMLAENPPMIRQNTFETLKWSWR